MHKDLKFLRFANISFNYIKEPGTKVTHVFKAPFTSSHFYCNIPLCRPMYYQICENGLETSWSIDISNKLRKPVTYKHNNQLSYHFEFGDRKEFIEVAFQYAYRINTHLLYTQKQFKYHNVLSVSDKDGYSIKLYIHFTIFLVSPMIKHLKINLYTPSRIISTSIPEPFRNPARQLNLVIPIRTMTHNALRELPIINLVSDDEFYFTIVSHTSDDIRDPLDVNFLMTEVFEDNRRTEWRKDRFEQRIEYSKLGDNKHRFTFTVSLQGWANFHGHEQIGWRLNIGRFKNPAFSISIEFVMVDYIQKLKSEMIYTKYLKDWLYRTNDWFNIDRNKFVDSDLDSLLVDRQSNFRPNRMLKYLRNMETNKKNKYDILNDLQYPFHYEFLKFVNEAGIDHGALSQDFFQTIFKALAMKLAKKFEANIVMMFVRVWMMCLKMKGRFDDFDLQCKIPASYINTLYFEIIFGKMDHLVRVTDAVGMIAYLQKLDRENIISDWVPRFAEKYLHFCEELDEIEIIMDALNITKKPRIMYDKLELIREYVYKIELNDFVNVLRKDLVNFGLILTPIASLGTEAILQLSFGWLNYDQFRSYFYLKQESLLEEENVDKLRALINQSSTWQGPIKIVLVMQKLFMQTIEQKVQNQDAKWLQLLLCFWTSKTHCVPDEASIHILLRYKDRPRVTASACFNEMEFPSYMAESIETFESILDESIRSVKHGFTSF